MKFCKDCKHYKANTVFGMAWLGSAQLDKCLHPDVQGPAGVVRGTGAYCDLRRSGGPCGMEAKLFEPRK